MIKQIILLVLWTSLALYCFAAGTTEVPKECTVGSPDYNETLCNEICNKDISQPYCANFTKSTAIPLSTPQQHEQHEAHRATGTPTVTPPQEAVRNEDISTSKIEVEDIGSSGISLGSSVYLSVSYFLLCYFLS